MLLVLIVLVVRLMTLGSLAILDPSEGRYSVIGQSMLLSGNLVTPHTFENGALVPFFAKPILHSWLTASSFLLFGVNEFAARLPSFAASILIVFSLYSLLKKKQGDAIAINSLLVLTSSALFFIMSGSCLVDITLTLGTVLMCVGFGLLSFFDNNFHDRKRQLGGYIMFLGAAIGFLSKGPIAIVLAGGPIFLWLLTTKNWGILRRIPWISGMIIFIGLTAPWFVLVEKVNPGFSQYFFVHENLLRFISSKYGDRYGSGHRHPFGTIWLMYLAAFLPWSLFWVKAVIFNRKSLSLYRDHFRRYILLCALFPAIFFTVGKQTSIYYVIPGVPWMAALTALIVPVSISRLSIDWVRITQRLVSSVAIMISVGLLIFGVFNDTKAIWLIIAALIIGTLSIGSIKLLVRLEDEPFDVEGYPRRFNALTSPEREYVASNFIATCATSSVMVLAVFTSALSARISMHESTRELIEKLKTSQNFHSSRPVFLRKIPHSAYFYSRLDAQSEGIKAGDAKENENIAAPQYPLNLGTLIENKEELEATKPRYVVATKKDIKKMELIEKGWVSVETVGPWSIFEDVNRSSENSGDAPLAEQPRQN